VWCIIGYYALFRLLAVILVPMCCSHILFNNQDTFNCSAYVSSFITSYIYFIHPKLSQTDHLMLEEAIKDICEKSVSSVKWNTGNHHACDLLGSFVLVANWAIKVKTLFPISTVLQIGVLFLDAHIILKICSFCTIKINSNAEVYKFALAFILMVITEEQLEQGMWNWIQL
jgi:hypothetical protein